MTENEKLRNENQTLRNLKIAKLKAEQQKVNEARWYLIEDEGTWPITRWEGVVVGNSSDTPLN